MKRSVILSAFALSVAGLAAAATASAHDRDDWGRGDRGQSWGRGHDEGRYGRGERGHGGYGSYRPAPRHYAAPRFDYRSYRENREYREHRRPRYDYDGYRDGYVYAEPDYPSFGLSFVLPLR